MLVPGGIITFSIIRLRNQPEREGRKSRFYGSHTGAAWLVLGGIFLVVATLLLVPGRADQQRRLSLFLPTGRSPRRSSGTGCTRWASGANTRVEAVFVLAQLGVMLTLPGVRALLQAHAHLHRPAERDFARKPDALGPLLPMQSERQGAGLRGGRPRRRHLRPGKIEDFTWKGLLDFATCTECGRCQSQCPAWNTGKPLSPKMLILELRDHAFAKAPWLLAGSDEARAGAARRGEGRGGAPAGRRRRRERRHRPRRAVVVHQLRGLRRAVPGRHRAHRPHRRHAPPPGDDRVRLPDRGRPRC